MSTELVNELRRICLQALHQQQLLDIQQKVSPEKVLEL